MCSTAFTLYIDAQITVVFVFCVDLASVQKHTKIDFSLHTHILTYQHFTRLYYSIFQWFSPPLLSIPPTSPHTNFSSYKLSTKPIHNTHFTHFHSHTTSPIHTCINVFPRSIAYYSPIAYHSPISSVTHFPHVLCFTSPIYHFWHCLREFFVIFATFRFP